MASLPYAALVAVVAAVPVATGSAAGPSLPKPGGLKTFKLRSEDTSELASTRTRAVHADSIVRVGTGSGREALRVRALDEQVLPRRERRGLVEQDPDDPGDSCSDLSSVDYRPFAVLARPRACRRPRLQVERHRSLQHALDVGVPRQLPSEPGFVSWTPIEGATGYDVWFGNLGKDQREGQEFSVGKIFSTITTVADEREYSTLRAPGQESCGASVRGDSSTGRRTTAFRASPTDRGAARTPTPSLRASLTPRRSFIPFVRRHVLGHGRPGNTRPCRRSSGPTTASSSTASTSPQTSTA